LFQSEESVEQLLLEKHEIHGRKIDCKKAVPREETNSLPQPRGGGGFRAPPMAAFGARNMFPIPDRRGSFEERVRLPFDRSREMARAFDRFKEPERGYEPYAPSSPPSKPMPMPSFANPYTAYQQPAQPQQQQQSYQPASYNTQSPNGYPTTSTPWEYAPQAPAAYGSAGGYPSAEPAYNQNQYSTPSNAYTQPVGYGAARPAATSTPRDRYRPY